MESTPVKITVATEERIRVRYGETDQMGHAYYANYLYWFEQARGAWCRDRGFTYKSLEHMGFMLPVVEAHVRYRGEVKYDDWITVRVWVPEVRRSSIHFQYEVINESTASLATEGYTWHVMMGAQARRAVTIPPEIRALLSRDPEAFERLP
jgi:acyl-CoA thioester hydrolase